MEWRDETEMGRRKGQGRAEVFVPGGRESTRKWERTDMPQLRLRMLGADQQRGAPWKELGMLDTVHEALGAPNRMGLPVHWSHTLQLSKLFHSGG